MAATQKQHNENESGSIGTKVPISCLREVGAYVCDWDGHLVRVPQTHASANTSPFFNIVSKDPLFATKVSDNPYVTISTARVVASNLNVPVNF